MEFFLYLIITIGMVHGKPKYSVDIPLFRQRTPQEAALNTNDIPEHDIFLDWLKPKPGPKPQNDSIALYRFLDSEFYGKVVIGRQTFNVLFDTNWGHSWILSNDCPTTKVGCWFHNRYDHSHSGTYKPNGTKFISKEGTYNLTGYYSIDNIYLGHLNVTKQLFVEMTSVPYINIFTKADGVMGLALKYGDYIPFFYNLLSQQKIKKPLFAVYLNRDKQSNKGGSLMLGAIDYKHIHHIRKGKEIIYDNITYVPVESNIGFWEFKIDRISIVKAKKSYPICETNCKGLSDTGSNTIVGPKDQIEAINKLIGAKPLFLGRYEVSCDTVMKLPPIDFVIDGKNFTLTSRSYIQKMSITSFTACISSFIVATTNTEMHKWMLGGAFLGEFYSIYDIGNRRVGFVRAY